MHLAVRLRTLSETQGYVSWIKDALQLCHQLVKCNRFMEANNYITTALTVNEAYKAEQYFQKFFLSLDVVEEKIDMTSFLVSIIEYCRVFLFSLATRLLRLEKNSVNNDLILKYPTKSKNHVLQRLLLFDEMEVRNLFPNVDIQPIMSGDVLGYDDAYKLFLYILSEFNRRNLFDPSKGIESDMTFKAEITSAFKYISLFEKNTASRISLQKRQVEILSEAVTTKIYSTYPRLLKCLQIQLAIGYSILIDEKLESLEEAQLVGTPQRHAIMCEIDSLVEKALSTLKMYKSTHVE